MIKREAPLSKSRQELSMANPFLDATNVTPVNQMKGEGLFALKMNRMKGANPSSETASAVDEAGTLEVLYTAQELVEAGLFDSAELILSYLVSTISPPRTASAISHHTRASILLGDCYFHSKDCYRARKSYESAYRNLKRARETLIADISSVAEKIAVCWYESGDPHEAIEWMKTRCPENTRSFKGWRLLGRWYEETTQLIRAQKTYAALYALQPYALASLVAALRCGADMRTVSASIPKNALGQYILQFGEAYYAFHNHDYKEAIRVFSKLPRDPDVLIQMADCYYEMGDEERAMSIWAQLPKHPTEDVRGMGRVADILRKRGKLDMLHKHVLQLIKLHPLRLETQLALVHHYIAKQNFSEALATVNRALQIDEASADAWLLKAQVLEFLNEDPLHCYTRSLQYHETIPAYEGLLKTYQATGREREAANLASEVCIRFPAHPGAYLIASRVVQPPEVSKALHQALMCSNNTYTPAVLALSHTSPPLEAIQIIKDHMRVVTSTPTLHWRLAELYRACSMPDLAHHEAQVCLRLDAGFEKARQAVEEGIWAGEEAEAEFSGEEIGLEEGSYVDGEYGEDEEMEVEEMSNGGY
ncbi:hypothetical protein BC832DRAFT_594762 [Gaertneriomyces semiglobifer]|nr:hypothetical protein BC832DRAFT_594762 [Gaertneriomyces semiglobifer]